MSINARKSWEKRILACLKRSSIMFISGAPFRLLVMLSAGWLTAQATEPTCTHVADFGDCRGDARDFCPRGIACGCKDQVPFCKCPSYRSHWQDYWHMGPKCDQLWSTLDLILVAAVPALSLSLVAAVVIQWSSYCKSKPKNEARGCSAHHERQARHQTRLDSEYVPELDDDSKYIFHPKGERDDKTEQKFNFPKIPLQSQPCEQPASQHASRFSYPLHQPFQTAMPGASDASVNPSQQVKMPRNWEDALPNVDYEEENPFSAMAMQQFPKSRASGFPQPDYASSPQLMNYRNDERAGRPYRIGRPVNTYN